MESADKWSDYWLKEGQQGEVFVNQDGHKHPQLADYWRTQFSGIIPKAKVIDIAAGGGSIFTDIDTTEIDLAATDLSLPALELLKGRIPATNCIVTNSEHMPFSNQSFQLVVSQFGVEYAGIDAFPEAARLVASGGRLAILCHISNGYIDSRTRGELEGIETVRISQFIRHAIDLTNAVYSGSAALFQQAEANFIPAERQLSGMVKKQPQGVHAHLYGGFRQLFERRNNYLEEDIIHWLTAMQGDLIRNFERLSTMKEAAQDEQQVREVCKTLQKTGLRHVGYSPFQLEGHDKPLAWSITAERP